jgi:hypothetical protein
MPEASPRPVAVRPNQAAGYPTPRAASPTPGAASPIQGALRPSLPVASPTPVAGLPGLLAAGLGVADRSSDPLSMLHRTGEQRYPHKLRR